MRIFACVVACLLGLNEFISAVRVNGLVFPSDCDHAEAHGVFLWRIYGEGAQEISRCKPVGHCLGGASSLYGFGAVVHDGLRSASLVGRPDTAVFDRCLGVETFLERLCLGQFYVSSAEYVAANSMTANAPMSAPPATELWCSSGTSHRTAKAKTIHRAHHAVHARRWPTSSAKGERINSTAHRGSTWSQYSRSPCVSSSHFISSF